VDLGEGIVAFERGSGVRCVVNLSGAPCPITGSVLVASEPVVDGVLPVDAAAWTR
jgi:alpha-glucosidase